ncbi:hypothetical protein L208DRAFT_1270165, partial [Tricholoma matsutake]
SAQHHAAYKKAHGHQGTSSKIEPHLAMPSELITEASQELPHYSPLFKDAAKSANLLDETGLDTWDSGPPYLTGPPSDSPHKVAFTKHLEEVMHGWCMHMLREQQLRWSNIPTKTLCEKMNRGIVEWESGRVVVAEYNDGHRECAMAWIWLQWSAWYLSPSLC